MVLDNLPLLGRLRRAVKNISFLLNYNLNRWKLASRIGGGSRSIKRLSFKDNYYSSSGLKASMDDDSEQAYNDSGSSSSSSSSRIYSRSMSSVSSSDQDDIDKRAEIFIANFRKQLQLERQISLELRYAKTNSFDSPSP